MQVCVLLRRKYSQVTRWPWPWPIGWNSACGTFVGRLSQVGKVRLVRVQVALGFEELAKAVSSVANVSSCSGSWSLHTITS